MSSLNEILSTLRQPVPPASLRVKEGAAALVYLPWHAAAALADERIGGAWSYHIVDHWIEDVPRGGGGNFIPTPLAHVRVCVTVSGKDASASREAVGVDDDPNGQRGTPFERATGAGLRRALALFGLGRELYDKATADRLLAEARGKPARQTQAAPVNGHAKPNGAPKPAGDPDSVAAVLAMLDDATTADDLDAAKTFARAAWKRMTTSEQFNVKSAIDAAEDVLGRMDMPAPEDIGLISTNN